MKANQSFRNADEAVSPVIGVILMVAITVVLAAVVFVLVSNLSKTSGKAPDVSWTTDETKDRISLIKADTGLNWDDFSIKGTIPAGTTAINWALNADATTGGADLGSTYDPIDTDSFEAGDFMDFCSTTTPSTGITTIQIIHVESNTVVYETQFNGVIACAT